MNSRLKDYVDLHRKLERELPKLPDNATPVQIDTNQRAARGEGAGGAERREARRYLHAGGALR